MTDELKKCPFCGGRAMRSYNSSLCPLVRCDVCRAKSMAQDHISEAVTAWNTRTPDPVVQELVKWFPFIAKQLKKLDKQVGDGPSAKAVDLCDEILSRYEKEKGL